MDISDSILLQISKHLNAKFEFINLSSNKIGGEGIKTLLENLNGNTSIMSLNLSKFYKEPKIFIWPNFFL